MTLHFLIMKCFASQNKMFYSCVTENRKVNSIQFVRFESWHYFNSIDAWGILKAFMPSNLIYWFRKLIHISETNTYSSHFWIHLYMLIISMDLTGYGSTSSDVSVLLESAWNMSSSHYLILLSFFGLTHNPCSQN